MITYDIGNDLDLDAAIEFYRASTLGERRPVEDHPQAWLLAEEAPLR